MPKELFPGRYESLVKIAQLVNRATQELGLDSCEAYGVETAVDEACSNIIEHSYKGEDQGNIEISYWVADNELTFVLKDTGQRFYPKKVPKLNAKASLRYREKHGLGLYFMYQWMDKIIFDYVDGQNILTMVKHKE